MKQTIYLLLPCLAILLSCNNQKEVPNTDIGVATEFINDLHKGDFKEAKQLLFVEESNTRLLEDIEKRFKAWPKDKLEYFKNNDILIINEVSPVTDSVTVVSYTTNYKKEEKNKVKVLRINGKWLIDFKYTFSGNL